VPVTGVTVSPAIKIYGVRQPFVTAGESTLDISMTSAKPPKRTIWLLKSTTKILPSLISQITCGCEKKLHGNKKSPVGHTGLLSARGGLISRTVNFARLLFLKFHLKIKPFLV